MYTDTASRGAHACNAYIRYNWDPKTHKYCYMHAFDPASFHQTMTMSAAVATDTITEGLMQSRHPARHQACQAPLPEGVKSKNNGRRRL